MIGRFLSDRARATPDRVAIEYGGREISYAELDAGAGAFACSFAEAGLKRGDRVATLTGNSPEHVQVLFACAQLGLILLPLSWRLAAPELRYQLDDAEPSLFLVEDEYADLARATGHRFERLAEPRPGVRHEDVAVEDDDPLFLIYTSGTTGQPKGALLTHANCFWTNVGFDLATGVHGDDVVLQVLPQFHVGGWNVQALLAWWKGARVILEREFDATRALRLIEEKRVTTMMGVPPIYLFLAQEPGFATADLSSLERAVVGGAPMPEALLETWAARGTAVVQGYGLTEAAPNVLCVPPEDAVRKLGCAGKPYPFVDVRLSAENELQVRGPNVFPGYWRNPDATAAAFTSDGWLRTGDVAELRRRRLLPDQGPPQGDVHLRRRERLSRRGRGGPACPSTGARRRGRRRAGRTLGRGRDRVRRVRGVGEEELSEWCRARLARFKVPKSFRLIGEIPRNGMGKVQKQELQATGVRRDRRRLHRRRRAHALAAWCRDTRAAARRGGARLRRARLLRRVDREDHRSRWSRTGHVLSLLRLEEGDLRRARPRSEPTHPQGDDRSVRERETRVEKEVLGFRGYFEFTASHPELYSIVRQSAFVSPEIFRYHYERIWTGYIRGLRERPTGRPAPSIQK